ncbi:hypothetical protein C8R47DRAFT_960558, partial [Mycena vitilis]
PGRLMADATIFMACSAILSVFNISKVRKDGVVVEPRLGQTSGTLSSSSRSSHPRRSHPLPFECLVEPRSAHALKLIQRD